MMVISSSLPAVNPSPVQPATTRGVVQPVTTSDARGIGESRNPETVRATDESPEVRDGRSERQRADSPKDKSGQQLDEAQLDELRELKARDREVRTHEQAHQAVGGQYAGAASYTYQRGPDGNQYAVGGEVSISLSPIEGNPQATVEKMRTVRAAAMAPAEPSGQDRAVAAQAMQLMLQAQMEVSVRQSADEGGNQERDSGRSQNSSASNTYRAVSGMADPAEEKAPFQAVA